MDAKLPDTPPTLLSALRNPEGGLNWHASWEKFLEIYHVPLRTMCANSYRYHTGGAEPPGEVVEDAVAAVVADFCTKAQHRYDPAKGKLRGFFKAMCNARIVDYLRKEKRMVTNADWKELAENQMEATQPDFLGGENESYRIALLKSMLEDLRARISPRQYTIFEMVKLKSLSPDQVAAELGVKRGVIDNTIYRVMNVLRDLASRDEYKAEWET
jgi:RNA polymerase sigma-70 factor (ECF subfamily)